MKVLVTYATRHGATGGIAQRIAQTLERSGLEVALEPVEEASEPALYDAFVIGSAAYAGHWLKEASAFVRDHCDLLASRPVWLFSSGPTGTARVDDKGRDVFEAARPAEFGEFQAHIKPRAEKVFFGAYDPDAEPTNVAERFFKGFMKVMPSVRDSLPSGDFREWPEIEAWAEKIAAELLPVPVTGATRG